MEDFIENKQTGNGDGEIGVAHWNHLEMTLISIVKVTELRVISSDCAIKMYLDVGNMGQLVLRYTFCILSTTVNWQTDVGIVKFTHYLFRYIFFASRNVCLESIDEQKIGANYGAN